MRLYVNGIGVWSPGLNGWTQARAVLAGELAYQAQATPLPMPAALHAAERRRAPATVKMALQVATEACDMAHVNASDLPCVFASSHGDTEISDYMCAELAQPQPALSPTRFHNSVHNAASGYWTIATHCMQPSNAITAGEHSFGAGLLEAAVLLQDAPHTLLVAYDMATPAMLLPLCPIPQAFAVALVLSGEAGSQSLMKLYCSPSSNNVQHTNSASQLAVELLTLMTVNPAARSLPLLHAAAVGVDTRVELANRFWEISQCR